LALLDDPDAAELVSAGHHQLRDTRAELNRPLVFGSLRLVSMNVGLSP
jgi:hypothetical protein